MSDLAVVILAAGLGTRMKSDTAKVLHRACGRELIAWPVGLARELGAGKVVAVLGHQADRVKHVLDTRFGAGAVDIAIQDKQLGTGHAVMQALPALGDWAGPILILYGDTPLLERSWLDKLLTAYRDSGTLALVTVRLADPTGYGRIVRDADGNLTRIVEQKDASPAERLISEGNAGIYCISAPFLREAVARLGTDNAQGELYLTDVAAAAAARGRVATVEAPPEQVLGVNDRADLATVEGILRGRITRMHARAGVTLRDPASTYIDAGVEIGADSELGPGVVLRGKTRIGARVRLDAGCVLEDTTVEDGAHLKPYTIATDSSIGPAAQVGPFAHLRSGSVLEADAHMGNFVETKKTRLGRGAKANHLAYLGDADIGPKVNVGAGTITCNYDGVNKFKTVIEEGAFIGSDSQLVAPVTVGAGAYVGAGSTITKDVPAGALALTRVEQKNVEGWAAKKKERQAAAKAAATAPTRK
ncbi:MAG: bifunctional UDP-N-acetylglucosamine diphosphorylase/glucosamine-1-phosphate N-acetyltransferase GlmU [Deltaproteobacteria bacterium]|nr:bifunctional UDP-N-acetylglucosamine diphosphorylase/glucosamine-1-phosphate N-acetyltransferase GlmU [Deltaproteobacteria bacterium]